MEAAAGTAIRFGELERKIKMHEEKRNQSFDILKLLCAFLVLCIHSDSPVYASLAPLARAAVPAFFMITGYFYVDTAARGHQKKQILRTVSIVLFGNGLYFLFGLASAAGNPWSFLLELLDGKIWLRFLLLNESPFRSHLWYLGALVYVLVMAFAVESRKLWNIAYRLIPVLLLGNLILGNYGQLLLGQALELALSRNFLLCGFPCFCLGHFCRTEKQKLERIPFAVLPCMLCLFSALTLGERRLLATHGVLTNQDFYASTIFVAFALLQIADRAAIPETCRLARFAARMGKKDALAIYIWGTIARTFIHKLVERLACHVPAAALVYKYISPLLVLAAISGMLCICRHIRSMFFFGRENEHGTRKK